MGLKNINFARLNVPMQAIRPQTIAANATVNGEAYSVGQKKGNLLVGLLNLGVLPTGAAGRLTVEMTEDEEGTSGWVGLPTNAKISVGADGYRNGEKNASIQLQSIFSKGDTEENNVTIASVDMDYVPKEARFLRFNIVNTSATSYQVSVSMLESGLYSMITAEMEDIDMFHNLLHYSVQ